MLYLKYFASSALLLALAFVGLGIFIQPLSGDLTRIGKFAERDFGWNAAQPTVIVRPNQDAAEASVVVLGDSFSALNIWQSVAMERTGLKVLTLNGEKLDLGCLRAWLMSVPETHPNARVVIVETVERRFLRRFGVMYSDCQEAVPTPFNVRQGATPTSRSPDALYGMPDPDYAIRAALKLTEKFPKATRSGDAVVAPLVRADLFTNNRSDLLLYYAGDEDKKEWTAAAIRSAIAETKQLEEFAKRMGLTLMVAVIPDKSTIYRKALLESQFSIEPPDVWVEIDDQGVAQINLRDTLGEVVDSIKDLYLPNDTHLSNRGYVVIGDAVAHRLRELLL